ncbi:hypothetical protein DL767_002794 [Monosporascus sp. MG133]|nr:hypothetical protein DL767_002794 [Monosporascus sp. MG133]
MVKGCKLLINVAKSDVASLGQGSTIKLELKGYEDSNDGKKTYSHKYAEVFNQAVESAQSFEWYFKLDAMSNDVNRGDVDLDYGQRWNLRDRDPDSDDPSVVDDSSAPKRGFILDTVFDDTELTLNLMKWQKAEIFLGSYKKGKWDVVPEITFRVTVTSGKNTDIHEFSYDPKDPSGDKSPYTQTITYHPAQWK